MSSLTEPDFGGPSPAELEHDRRVTDAVLTERVKREARRIVDAEDRPREPLPPFKTLRERLASPAPESQWRIDGWQPRHGRVMLSAQFKSGKTTLRDNYIRSKVDGDPFLDSAPVEPIRGSLVLLDNEMSEHTMDRWFAAQGIRNDHRVIVVPLRGKAASFNILDAEIRREWAVRFRSVRAEDLILDCLRPMLDALGLDERTDGGRFLVAFDALLAEAGIPEALVVQHMGHQNERARGDSRFRDWPDAEWRVVRQDDDPASPRFISAYGRDVDIPEAQLVFDPFTRHLSLGGGSRRDAAGREALDAIVALLTTTSEAMSGRQIKAAMEDSEHPRATVEAALKLGIRDRVLTQTPGPRNATLYAVSRSVPPVSRDASVECPAAYIKRDTRTLTDSALDPADTGTLKPIEEGETDVRY